MRSPRVILTCAALIASVWSTSVIADGGAVVWMGERSGTRGVVLVAPASPRVGEVEIAWIGAIEGEVTVVAAHDCGAVVFASCARTRIRDEVHGILPLSRAGVWKVELDWDGAGAGESVLFDIIVDEPLPRWTTLSMYLFAWVPMSLLGVLAASRSLGALRVR